MKHFLLFYTVDTDFVVQRAAYRDAHLQQAWDSHDRGELILGGALAEPADQAVLLFAADSAAVVEAFARTDPYVANGLVKKWRVREWITVAGEQAIMPMRSEKSK
jgi:uncharacterized protein